MSVITTRFHIVRVAKCVRLYINILLPSKCFSYTLVHRVTIYVDQSKALTFIGLRMFVRICIQADNNEIILHLHCRPYTCWISLTHLGRVTHICVGKLTIIASDNGLSPGRRQAIIWTNDEILLIGPLGTNLNEILIEIHTVSFKKTHLKMSSAKWQPSCLGPNVLKGTPVINKHLLHKL